MSLCVCNKHENVDVISESILRCLISLLAVIRSFEDERINEILANVHVVLNTIETIDRSVVFHFKTANWNACAISDNNINDLTIVFLEEIRVCFQSFSDCENPVMDISTGNTSLTEVATLSVSASSSTRVDGVGTESLSILINETKQFWISDCDDYNNNNDDEKW